MGVTDVAKQRLLDAMAAALSGSARAQAQNYRLAASVMDAAIGRNHAAMAAEYRNTASIYRAAAAQCDAAADAAEEFDAVQKEPRA